MAQQSRQSLMAVAMRLYGSFVGKVGTVLVSGPYQVAAGEMFVTGRTAGEIFPAGRAEGQVFSTGTVAGEVDGRSS